MICAGATNRSCGSRDVACCPGHALHVVAACFGFPLHRVALLTLDL